MRRRRCVAVSRASRSPSADSSQNSPRTRTGVAHKWGCMRVDERASGWAGGRTALVVWMERARTACPVLLPDDVQRMLPSPPRLSRRLWLRLGRQERAHSPRGHPRSMTVRRLPSSRFPLSSPRSSSASPARQTLLGPPSTARAIRSARDALPRRYSSKRVLQNVSRRPPSEARSPIVLERCPVAAQRSLVRSSRGTRKAAPYIPERS